MYKLARPGSVAMTGVVVFCAIFAFLVISFARVSSAVFDEVTHLPAGYSYLRWSDYRINPEHPPFIKKLAALPLLLLGVKAPAIEADRPEELLLTDAIETTDVRMRRAWALALIDHESHLIYGHALLYGVRDKVTQRFAGDIAGFDPAMIPSTAVLNKDDFINDADHLLFWGRMPILLLGLSLAVLIYLWAAELFGFAGGVLAIALICLDPNFIAHSGLVTTDVGVTLFMFGAVYFLWRTCRRISIGSVFLMSLFVALAFATKFTAVLLLPIMVILVVVRTISKKEWPVSWPWERTLISRSAKALAVIALFIVAAVFSYGSLWAMYDFRFSPVKNAERTARNEAIVRSDSPKQIAEQWPVHEPGHFPVEATSRRVAAMQLLLREGGKNFSDEAIKQAMVTAPLDLPGRILLLIHRHKLLPEAYLYGLIDARTGLLTCDAFLRGKHSTTGFRWTYFLWTFLLKTPLPTMVAMIAAILFAFLRRILPRSSLLFLLVPVVFYWGVSLASSISIGHRHLLPIYPFLFVMCGGLAVPWALLRPRIKPWIAVAALAAVVMSSLVVFIPQRPYIAPVYPHYLAYFNELAGGPPNGYKSLVDSNLDWGQDLKNLKTWLDNKRLDAGTPFYLCYFGMADPRYYQIPNINTPGGYTLEPVTRFDGFKAPCYFAISATNLQGAYFAPEFRNYYPRLLKNAILVDKIGYSIFIYYFPPPGH